MPAAKKDKDAVERMPTQQENIEIKEHKTELDSNIQLTPIFAEWRVEYRKSRRKYSRDTADMFWDIIEEHIPASQDFEIEKYILDKINSMEDDRYQPGSYRVTLLVAETGEQKKMHVFEFGQKDIYKDNNSMASSNTQKEIERAIQDTIRLESLRKTYENVSGKDEEKKQINLMLEQKNREMEELKLRMEQENDQRQEDIRRLEESRREQERELLMSQREQQLQQEENNRNFFTSIASQNQKSSETMMMQQQKSSEMMIAMMQNSNNMMITMMNEQSKRESEQKESQRQSEQKHMDMMMLQQQESSKMLIAMLSKPKEESSVDKLLPVLVETLPALMKKEESTVDKLLPIVTEMLPTLLKRPESNFDKITAIFANPMFEKMLDRIINKQDTSSSDWSKLEKLLASPLVANIVEKMTKNPTSEILGNVIPEMLSNVMGIMTTGIQSFMGESDPTVKKLQAIQAFVPQITSSICSVIASAKTPQVIAQNEQEQQEITQDNQEQKQIAVSQPMPQQIPQMPPNLGMSDIGEIIKMIETTDPEILYATLKQDQNTLNMIKQNKMLMTQGKAMQGNIAKLIKLIEEGK